MSNSQRNRPANAHWDLDRITSDLRGVRRQWRKATGRMRDLGRRDLPCQEALATIVSQLEGALFPMRLGPATLSEHSEEYYVGATLDAALNALVEQVKLELRFNARQTGAAPAETEDRAREIVRQVAVKLPDLRAQLDKDVMAAFHGDPAARSVDEVLLCYPGVAAMIHHRLAHTLYHLEVPLLARIVSELAHSATGIDIHPGADIGAGFFIDHGTGVVIGETSRIGDRVRLYHGVTLGAFSPRRGRTGGAAKRHPTIGDDVTVYPGATILGGETEIGRGTVVGGNATVTESVPPDSRVVPEAPRAMVRRARRARGESAPDWAI